MKLWNFSHNVTHLHVYILLAAILLAITLLIHYRHKRKMRDLEKEQREELDRLKAGLTPEEKKTSSKGGKAK